MTAARTPIAGITPDAPGRVLPFTPPVSVAVDGERLVVDRLVLHDPGLAAWLADRSAEERPMLVERALRIGLTALQSVGVTMNLDVVRSEFDRWAEQARTTNERATEALEQVLRANFADVEGRLPRTLETFLGDRGRLKATVQELFDPNRRDSAIGRMSTMLAEYFDGDASRLATLLDPTRSGSPLHDFRLEVSKGFRALEEKLVELQAAQSARAGERARSSAKGGDFEDLLEGFLGEAARGAGDLLERTGADSGDAGRSKKGDFVLTLNPGLTAGSDVRVVIEAKDRRISGREMRDELREAKVNRDAAVGLVFFTPAHAPTGIAPFDVRSGDVYAVVDPADPDPATLEAAVRLARLIALTTIRGDEAEVDAAAIGEALTAIREQLEAVRAMKTQLTTLSGMAGQVNTGLDRLRDGIVAQVARAEQALAVARST